MSYKTISKSPLIHWTATPGTMYKIIEMSGAIEELTRLYGYCVGIGYGKQGFNWIIGNLVSNQIEIYWTKIDKVNPENVEIIAGILKKRSGRDEKKILNRAFVILGQMQKSPGFAALVQLAAKEGIANVSFEMMAKSDDVEIMQNKFAYK